MNEKFKSILYKSDLTKDEVIYLFSLSDKDEIAQLYKRSDEVRKEFCGDDVHLLSLIHI